MDKETFRKGIQRAQAKARSRRKKKEKSEVEEYLGEKATSKRKGQR